MAKTAKEIITDIDAHLQKSSAKNYSDFYIGITKNKEGRLHGDHNAPEKGHWFISRKAINDEEARKVEAHFLNKRMDGGDGGGDDESVFVYCYRISDKTKER